MNGVAVTIVGMANIRWLLFGSLILCSAGFVSIVTGISSADPEMFGEPLSNFRYGRWAGLGIVAFLLLIAIGVIYIAITRRFAERDIQFVSILATILIIFVAVTPTVHAGHEFAANGLMILLYGFFCFRLYRADSFWFFVCLAAPLIVLASVYTWLELNFGTIQKSMIFLLVVMVVLDSAYHLNIAIPLPERKACRSARHRRRENRWERLLDDI